jgi:hypothetical protein
MTTDHEIEATQRKSAELEAELAKLMDDALDPAKNMSVVAEAADKEIARFTEVLKSKDAPQGECLGAAIELIADWSDVELAALEGLKEAGALKSSAQSTPTRSSAPRRGGMRV